MSAFFAGLFLVLAFGIFSNGYIARADDTPVDNAGQTTATTTDSALPAEASVEQSVATSTVQTEVATSTDGTGGLSGGTIVTGDATASTTVDNELNTNVAGDVDSPGETNSSSITASTTDAAELTTEDETVASTGGNTAEGGDSVAAVVTGDAVATALVINEVNTNIFNSDGLILFLNQLFGGGFDLNWYDLSFFFVGSPGASPTVDSEGRPQCTLLTCLNSSSLNVFNDNTATVTNSVLVRSSTGDNLASSTGPGDAAIATGDAYAAANVVNLVNTNIVNSSYLLLAFNNFGNLVENITLPGTGFFNKLFAQGAASSSINSSTYAVATDNTVEFAGTTTAEAITGDNVASSTLATTTDSMASTTDEVASTTPGGVIETGNAYASANTYTQANTTSVGGTSVFMLFRVSGDWTGSIVGLPEGLSALIFPDGDTKLIEIVSNGATTTPEAAQLLEEYNSSHFAAISTSTAVVENNVDVAADTGNNRALAESGSTTVSTGNAYAVASVVNLVNTNIVGQNWIFAVFNIFGDMGGDIVFSDAAPKLAVSAQVSPDAAAPGGSVVYTFTVTNTGNADASDVLLSATFDNTLLTFAADGTATSTLTGRSWRVGVLPRGMSRTIIGTAAIGTNFPAGQTATVPLTIAASNDSITSPVASETADANITVTSPAAVVQNQSNGAPSGGGGGGGFFGGFGATRDPQVTVTKSASLSTATTSPITVDYKVVVENHTNAGALHRAVLTDTLYDPSGKVMYNRSWNLDTLAPADQITLTYSVEFASTTAGDYRNVARVSGWANHPTAGSATSTQVASIITLSASGEVLGTSTEAARQEEDNTVTESCRLRLEGFLARGKANKTAEVIKLQTFLSMVGAKLPITGFFGPLTQTAVKNFQQKYASEILAPLGLRAPTGSVYGMTQRKVNQIACSQ